MSNFVRKLIIILSHPKMLLERIINIRYFRKLFIAQLYCKPIAHSETIIALMKNASTLDESYWIGKLRQFAHVVDKGLHRGDFSKGHGNSGYIATKMALTKIRTKEGLDDPTVQWAIEKVTLYEEFQSNKTLKLTTEHVSTHCSYKDLSNVIKTRRSIRSFTNRKVTTDVIHKIVKVLDWGPSSCHRQPGRVYASNNNKTVRQCVNLHVGAGCFTDIEVPLFLVFCADCRLYNMPDELAIPYIDVSLGIQNCLLVAHTLGLSLTPLIWSFQGEWQEKELRKIFSIPDYFQIILSATGGYPSDGALVPPRKKTELFIAE